MGTETKIQWTDHTWNPWRGCWKISEGCANCYADSQSRRNPAVLGEWGKGARRVEGSADYWRKPLAWNRAAEKAGKRRRVFCMSLGDIFEDREDLDPLRVQVWETIHATPWLDWQLLTKRPAVAVDCARSMGWPGNAWLGFSAENQSRFDERWAMARELVDVVPILFVSHEPALGPLVLPGDYLALGRRGWVITGGESGPRSRPYDLAWPWRLVTQTREAGVPLFVKQVGDHPVHRGERWPATAPKGGDPNEWPQALRVREMPGGDL
jgi:protein gp37